MKLKFAVPALILLTLICAVPARAQDKPIIVLVVMDNLGWGEIGVYGGGILRGAEPPIPLDTPDPCKPK
ncbi:MAG: hypothetical protein ACR2QT_10930 [Woeseiaceae bacterium]